MIGPDGRRNLVQPTHCTADNLRMVYNLPGDLYLEVALPDGSSELLFAERGRFLGLVSGVGYHVRGSAATGGGGSGGGSSGGGSALIAARERGSQRAVRFAEKPQTAPEPWEVAAQAAAATPWDPQPEPAPQSQRRPAVQRHHQPPPTQGTAPGAQHPSSAEVEAILARTGGPLGGRHGNGVRGPGSTGPIQMTGGPPGGAYGGSSSAAQSRQPLPSGPGIDGPGPGGGNVFAVGDFQSPAGAASGAGAETRPRSRGGLCAREGIMPVSRGLRDTPWQGGRVGVEARGGRFDAAATDFEATHTQTHTTTHATSAARGVLPGT